MKLDKLCVLMAQGLEFNIPAKNAFHREAKKVLKELASELGLSSTDYDLRSNKGGIAVSGEVTLHTETIYVQISQSVMGERGQVLYRTCKHRRDFSGGTNNFVPVRELAKVKTFYERQS